MRKAKIVCTIGPASRSPDVLERLIRSGMNAARLNFSHGSPESHAEAVKTIRAAADRLRVSVAVIQDLQGPRIRVGDVAGGTLTVLPGQRVQLTVDPAMSSSDVVSIPVTYPHLPHDVKVGARILIDDGLIELVVERIAEPAVYCRVETGGEIRSHKGMNLPETKISAPTLTDKDREDLRFGIQHQVDYVALSFVRGPDDVAGARKVIAEYGGEIPIIAKIERPEALQRLELLLEEADGVMIARGDLGVEMGPEAVPVLQKRMIAEANRRRRLVITATQMLESMTVNSRPTRAEASDVANAVYDGTHAVMLSGETAVGKYPVEVVRAMHRIVVEAERLELPPIESGAPASISRSVCAAAVRLAEDIEADALVAITRSGRTAETLSSLQPSRPIIALCEEESMARRLCLWRGIVPVVIVAGATENAVERVTVEARKLLPAGAQVVALGAAQGTRAGQTNFIRLLRI